MATEDKLEEEMPQQTSPDPARAKRDADNRAAAAQLTNLADDIDEQELNMLGAKLKREVETDITSRKSWLANVDSWIELTTQVMEEKSWPWAGASNIKFPLVSTAAVQFHARAFPALLKDNTPVRGKVIGKDPNGTKAARALRVQTYMSYQVIHEIEEWVEDMDRALFILPILGAMYKKTFYSPKTGRPESQLIHPRDFIINYDAQNFEHARKTHRLWKSPNEIKEQQNRRLYRQFDGDDKMEVTKTASKSRDKTQNLNNPGTSDPYALQELYEIHCLLDLDDPNDENKGYKKPYIVTIREADGKVFRIVTGYSEKDVLMDKGNLISIEAKRYFTPYFFLPDPESKTHGLGFGTMVGPINAAVNTLVNQLTDAGTNSNLQSGFLGRGARLKGGNIKFTPGEWKPVNATGDDLRKSIFPMPTREPSNVLFQLLGLLIDSGKDLSSVQDLMVGRNPGQNQPFSTSQMVMEQGLQVFNGIYKRIYRAMTKEFKLLFAVNGEYLDLANYMKVLDDSGQEVQQALQERGPEAVMAFLAKDFSKDEIDVLPTAEPDMVAEVQKAVKAESLLQKVGAGLPLNLQAVTKRMLEAEEHDDIAELLNVPEPAPDPEIAFREQELEIKGFEADSRRLESESKSLLLHVQAEVLLAGVDSDVLAAVHKQYMEEKKLIKDEYDSITKRMKEANSAKKTDRDPNV